MKVKVSEASGLVLDYLVARCEKQVPSKATGEPFLYEHRLYLQDFTPSTNWAHGGPIIDRKKIGVVPFDDTRWEARCACGVQRSLVRFIERRGPTGLIAAMRCHVASELGDEVEVPEELL